MCGIAGIVSRNPERAPDVEQLRRLCGSLVHRGPDGEGIYADQKVAIGMRRLAIIDLLTGDQPVANETGDVQVVFNGEIYNYRELRALLETRGHRFKTAGDSETIAHAYEEWGLDFVQHLNGMFAIALWDRSRERLVLARDRFGIKPLFYAQTPESVYFSSELRPLIQHTSIPFEIDRTSLAQYLMYQYVPSPRSMIEGVSKLRPGHLLVVENGHADERRYWKWDLGRSEKEPIRNETEAVEQFRDTLRRAVRMEMVSDVPLGVLLSGGLDSSSVALAMTEASSGTVRSFSIGFDDKSYDESAYARLVATALGTQHTELTLTTERMLQIVEQLGTLLDEPLGDSSFIPTYLVAALARQHVTVALGGDGGDEMLAGYSTIQAHKIAHYYEKLPAGMHELLRRASTYLPTSHRNISLDFKIKSFLRGAHQHPSVRHHTWIGAFTPAAAVNVMQDGSRCTDTDHILQPALDAWQERDSTSLVNGVLYMDALMYLEGDILQKVDRASMACSLETRVPLLNHELASLMERVPDTMKLRGLTRKYLLRRAVEGRLPDAIVRRPKKGFGIPLSAWLCKELKPLAGELLDGGRLQQQGLFRATEIAPLLEDHWALRRDNRQRLWALMAFQLWYRAWAGAT